MGFLKNVKSAVGGVDKQLIKTGILARGLVVECKPTSVSTGSEASAYGPRQVCVVTVEITGVPGQGPYRASCHHPIPRIYLPQLQSGQASVAVRVDPNDPQHIALDLETDPPPVAGEQWGDGSPMVGAAEPAPAGDEITTHASPVKGSEILARGLPCRVVIVGWTPLGVKDSSGLDATGFVLSVFAEGKAPYQVQIGVGVPPEAVPLVYAGAQLPGKMLAENPELVTIDWQAALAGYAAPPAG